MRNKCVIVIPIYKENPDIIEISSFRQALVILRKWDITIVTHENLDISLYENEGKIYNKNLNIEYVNSFYLDSLENYNKLCLQNFFYKKFLSYDYMLIYQLDAWVFRDELEYWCDKKYHYIGAPFFWSGFKDELYRKCNGGNGGFSLRNVKYHYNLLCYSWPFNFYINLNDGFKGLIRSLKQNVQILFTKKRWDMLVNEDYFVSCYIPLFSLGMIRLMKSITIKEAASFSFEHFPLDLFKICDNKLPFGCHAFIKYDFDSFWRKYILVDRDEK